MKQQQVGCGASWHNAASRMGRASRRSAQEFEHIPVLEPVLTHSAAQLREPSGTVNVGVGVILGTGPFDPGVGVVLPVGDPSPPGSSGVEPNSCAPMSELPPIGRVPRK